MFMPKTGVSVTLRDDNLLWLKSRTLAAKKRSLSETLDEIVTAARVGGGHTAGVRSVSGTIDIADDDPGLEKADDYIRGIVRSSLTLPLPVREGSDKSRPSGRQKKGRRRG